MANKVIVVGALLVSMAAGCTSRGWYDSAQNDQRWRCDSEPLSQQKECREQTSMSFDEYEREREAILDEPE